MYLDGGMGEGWLLLTGWRDGGRMVATYWMEGWGKDGCYLLDGGRMVATYWMEGWGKEGCYLLDGGMGEGVLLLTGWRDGGRRVATYFFAFFSIISIYSWANML